jgi:hypothetical protein
MTCLRGFFCVEPESVAISILPGYWSIVAIIAMICILVCIPFVGFLLDSRRLTPGTKEHTLRE